MAGSAPEFWQARGLRARLLLPLSSLFAALSASFDDCCTALAYGGASCAAAGVVVVGNIAVGGSGKTPWWRGCVSGFARRGMSLGS